MNLTRLNRLKNKVILFGSVLLLSFTCKRETVFLPYETTQMNLLNAENSGTSPQKAGDSVYRNAYAIQVDLLLETKMDSLNLEGKGNVRYYNEDKVIDLQITSSSTFNGVSPYQSLNHFFLFRKSADNYLGIAPETYTNILSGDDGGDIKLADFRNNSNYLLLMNPPAAGNYVFYVSGTFSDGRILSDSIEVNLYE